MRRMLPVAVAACVAVSTACADRSITSARSIMPPEPRYSLSREELASLRPGLNTVALERLLARLSPEARKTILPYFSRGVHAGILGVDDPELDALVQEVWAPAENFRPRDEPSPALRRAIDLALVRELADAPHAGALVIRQAGDGRDLIVLPEKYATPSQLFVAFGALSQDRLDHGVPVADRKFYVLPAPIPSSTPQQQATARMLDREHRADLERLQRSEKRVLPGLGDAYVLEFRPATKINH